MSAAEISPVETLQFHRRLLASRGRTNRLKRAVFEVVKSGDVVVDLGCGTGILSFFACRAGARRIYAIESGSSIRLARHLARQNGLLHKICFLEGDSAGLKLPEKADVLLTETHGSFGLDAGMLASAQDAKKRFLKKNGRMVPQSIELFAALVEDPSLTRHFDFWSKPLYGMNFSSLRGFASNNLHPIEIKPASLLHPGESILSVDFRKENKPLLEAGALLKPRRNGTAHGLGGWFKTQLCRGVSISNHPKLRYLNWNQAFLPFEKPLAVRKGQGIRLRLRFLASGAFWNWELEADGRRLNQSTFRGFPLDRETLRTLSAIG